MSMQELKVEFEVEWGQDVGSMQWRLVKSFWNEFKKTNMEKISHESHLITIVLANFCPIMSGMFVL